MQFVKVNNENASTLFLVDNSDYFSRNMLNRTEAHKEMFCEHWDYVLHSVRLFLFG
jgi:hypothetical protein